MHERGCNPPLARRFLLLACCNTLETIRTDGHGPDALHAIDATSRPRYNYNLSQPPSPGRSATFESESRMRSKFSSWPDGPSHSMGRFAPLRRATSRS